MKTEKEVNEARAIIAQIYTDKLTPMQKANIAGILIALVWVVEGPNCTTIKRLLAGEKIATDL